MNNRHALVALINRSGYICYNKKMAKAFGLNTAVLFAELLNIYSYFNCEEFFFEQAKISDDTSLSKFQIAEATKILVDNGILTVSRKGIPCKNWYTLNLEKALEIIEKLTSSSQETEQQEVKKIDYSRSNNLTAGSQKTEPLLTRTNTRTNTRTEFVVVDNKPKSEKLEREKISGETTTTKKESDGQSDFHPQKSKRFFKPSVEQIQEYCKKRGNCIDAQHFFDYYESKGWLVGRVPMRNWQAAIRTWERNCNIPNKKSNGSEMSRIESGWSPADADLNKF